MKCRGLRGLKSSMKLGYESDTPPRLRPQGLEAGAKHGQPMRTASPSSGQGLNVCTIPGIGISSSKMQRKTWRPKSMRPAAFGKCGNARRQASETCLGSRLSSLGAGRLKRQGYNLKRHHISHPATSQKLSDEEFLLEILII